MTFKLSDHFSSLISKDFFFLLVWLERNPFFFSLSPSKHWSLKAVSAAKAEWMPVFPFTLMQHTLCSVGVKYIIFHLYVLKKCAPNRRNVFISL